MKIVLINRSGSAESHRVPCALTFGKFDGVHRGHQALLAALKQAATQRKLPVAVLLFEPQPETFFSPSTAAKRLTTLRDKAACLAQAGVDFLYCMRFTDALATQSAEAFVTDVLATSLNAQYLLTGRDARFGYQRLGDVQLLKTTFAALGREAACFDDHLDAAKRVSSTQIRSHLLAGDLHTAAHLLGRPYTVRGRVSRGQGLGQQLGVPTANVRTHYQTPLLQGVFAVELCLPTGQVVPSVANWGMRPTVCGQRMTLEVHGLDLQADLYGQWVAVRFLHKIREERRFETLAALTAQIKQDIAEARVFFQALREIV